MKKEEVLLINFRLLRDKPLANLQIMQKKEGKEMEPIPCNACRKPTTRMCGGCLLVAYCSEECQRNEYGNHKPRCKKLREIAIALLEEAIGMETMVGAESER